MKELLKKLWDSLFKVDYSDFILDGQTYDLTREELEELKKKIENM